MGNRISGPGTGGRKGASCPETSLRGEPEKGRLDPKRRFVARKGALDPRRRLAARKEALDPRRRLEAWKAALNLRSRLEAQ
jgi:hypothetical protein